MFIAFLLSAHTKAVPGEITGRLVLLGKGAAFPALPVPTYDNGGANALDDPLGLSVFENGVITNRLAFMVCNYE